MINKLLTPSFKLPFGLTHTTLQATASTNSHQIPKQLTLHHIQKSNNLSQLLNHVDIFKVNENPHFQPFLSKMISFLDEKALKDQETEDSLDRVIFQIRRFSSVEMHADWNDLLNYVLLFKKLSDIHKDRYRLEGFEYRASMLIENMPKVSPLYGIYPSVIGLLHYMGVNNGMSKNLLKSNIGSYITRYFSMNSSRKNDIDIDLALIALSGSSLGSIKIPVQCNIYERCQVNISKRWFQYKKKLKISLLCNPHTDKFNILPLGSKLTIKDFHEKETCINTKENFVKIIDMFINLLRLQYCLQTQKGQPEYIITKNLNQYFLYVFMLSRNMQIQLWTLPTKKFQQEEILTENIPRQSVSLWKIGKYLMKSFSERKIYVKKSGKLMSTIIGEVAAFHKNDSLTKIKRNQILRENGLQIFQIFYYCPEYLLENVQESAYIPQNCVIKEIMLQIITEILKKLPQNSKSIRLIFTKLYRTKQYLFNDKQWKSLFNSIIKQDDHLEFFEIYFLMAETNKPHLQSLISVQNLVIQLKKKTMFLKEKYHIAHIDYFAINNENSLKVSEKKNMLVGIYNWEAYLLKIHALMILLGQKQALKRLEKEFDITARLKEWIEPYTTKIGAYLNRTLEQSISDKKIDSFSSRRKPVPYFTSYCFEIFESTSCPNQFELLKIIINHPSFQNWLKSPVLPEMNIFDYFQTFMVALNDPQNREKYLSLIPVNKFLEIDYRRATFFIGFQINYMQKYQTPLQMQMLLEFMERIQSVYQARDYLLEWYHHFRAQKFLNKEKGLPYEDWKKCNNLIISYLIKNIEWEKNFEFIRQRKLSFLLKFINQIEECQTVGNTFIDKENIASIIKIFTSFKLASTRQLSICIAIMDGLGWLNQNICREIQKLQKFQINHSAYHFLMSYEDQIDPSLQQFILGYRIQQASFQRLKIFARYLTIESYYNLRKILNTYYNQQKKQILEKELQRSIAKLGLEEQVKAIDEQIRLEKAAEEQEKQEKRENDRNNRKEREIEMRKQVLFGRSRREYNKEESMTEKQERLEEKKKKQRNPVFSKKK